MFKWLVGSTVDPKVYYEIQEDLKRAEARHNYVADKDRSSFVNSDVNEIFPLLTFYGSR